MDNDNLSLAGLLIFIGIAQFLIFMNVAAYLYPGYSVSENYISDLGVGPSAYIFNSSIIILGILGITGSYLLYKEGIDKVFVFLLFMASIGAAGVGVFPENMGILHTIPSFITFLFAGFGALYSYRVDSSKLRYIWLVMGVISLAALLLFASKNYMGLGKGGMERMIVYPVFVWLLGISSSIVNKSIRLSRK